MPHLPGWLYKGEHKQVVSNLGFLCPIYQDGYIRVNISNCEMTKQNWRNKPSSKAHWQKQALPTPSPATPHKMYTSTGETNTHMQTHTHRHSHVQTNIQTSKRRKPQMKQCKTSCHILFFISAAVEPAVDGIWWKDLFLLVFVVVDWPLAF